VTSAIRLVTFVEVQCHTDCRLFVCAEPCSIFISWLLVSTAVWLAGIFAIRYALKLLLSYHAWMYESRGNVSLLTKLWLVITPYVVIFVVDDSIIYARWCINIGTYMLCKLNSQTVKVNVSHVERTLCHVFNVTTIHYNDRGQLFPKLFSWSITYKVCNACSFFLCATLYTYIERN